MASKKEKYSLGNSRSPMMFRKKKENKEKLSRSLDDLISSVDNDDGDVGGAEWPELASVRKMSPVVMCILPPCSADFVSSALLSLGATPLLTEDENDVVKDLRNCRAVVVDVSAPTNLIVALMEYFDPTGDILMVVASTQVGSNNRKRDLTVQLVDRCGPSLIVGRMADIYTLGQVMVERAVSSGSDEGEEEEEERDSAAHHPQISIECSPPTDRKSSTPAVLHSRIMQKIQHRGPARRYTDLSPCVSPQTSPRHSVVGMSPSTSPRASPSGVRRGLQKHGRKIGRTATLHPRITMKGQFQDFSLLEVNVDDAIQYGHRLAAHSRASVFFMETSLLTDGETDIEILNPQSGTKYLHSLLPCSAAIAAACVSSVLRETDDSEDALLHQFSHALSLWCVAVEEAGSHANQSGTLLPGTMRQSLIDALHYLKEPHVRSAAKLSLYCMENWKTAGYIALADSN